MTQSGANDVVAQLRFRGYPFYVVIEQYKLIRQVFLPITSTVAWGKRKHAGRSDEEDQRTTAWRKPVVDPDLSV
jgi:hypothetical protein